MVLNKDLYERYLAKKAKKLGVSVESLRGTSTQQTHENSEPELVQEQPVQQTYTQPSYTQPTYQVPIQQPVSEPAIIDRRENKFAVIGFPLGHSLSSVIHTVGFKSMGLDATYETLETDPEDLVTRIKALKNENYKGFNLTIPLKLPVALFVDEVDKSADIASAINTVVINPDRTMKGYNTDVIGFKKAIPNDFKLFGKVAGILGTGGASRAATVALAQSGVKEIRYYTRNIPNTLDLLNYMRRIFPQVQFDAYQIEYIRDLSMVDILVNTTPIGMLGRSADMTPVEKPQLATLPQGALVYDVIYN
ncbi:shikimate dehydrogenase, partial [bacterium]|nr:shikimate dehydrogenase [bacterium]